MISTCSMKESPNWYGIEDVGFIWHGSWSDPEIEYKGKRLNATIVEDTMWERFREECEEQGKNADDYIDYFDNHYILYYDNLYQHFYHYAKIHHYILLRDFLRVYKNLILSHLIFYDHYVYIQYYIYLIYISYRQTFFILFILIFRSFRILPKF